MTEQAARITSIDALEAFRTSLILYVSKARPTVEEVSADIMRVKLWLQNDQRMQLEGLCRRRRKELEEAQAELFSARVAVLKEETSAQQMAVHRARRAVEEVETKLKRLKAWNREFDSRVEPLVKQLEKLHSVLSVDMLRATTYLAQTVANLQAYAELSPSTDRPTSPAPSTAEPGESAGKKPDAPLSSEGGHS